MRFAAFALVGLSGFLVQMTTLEVLLHASGAGPIAATAIAVELAVIHNFAWHERWTWRDRRRSGVAAMVTRLLQFHAANGVLSLVVSVACVALLTRAVGWPPLASNVVAVALTGLLNFVALDRWIFAAGRPSDATRAAPGP